MIATKMGGQLSRSARSVPGLPLVPGRGHGLDHDPTDQDGPSDRQPRDHSLDRARGVSGGTAGAAGAGPSRTSNAPEPFMVVLVETGLPGPDGGRSAGEGRQGSINADTRMPGFLGHRRSGSSSQPRHTP